MIYSPFPGLITHDFSENSSTFSVQFVQSKARAQWCSGVFWLAWLLWSFWSWQLHKKELHSHFILKRSKKALLHLKERKIRFWHWQNLSVRQNSYRQRGISHAICIWVVVSPSFHDKETCNTLTLRCDPFFSHTCTPPESTQVFDLLRLGCSIIPDTACGNRSFPWDGVCFDSCYRNQFLGWNISPEKCHDTILAAHLFSGDSSFQEHLWMYS